MAFSILFTQGTSLPVVHVPDIIRLDQALGGIESSFVPFALYAPMLGIRRPSSNGHGRMEAIAAVERARVSLLELVPAVSGVVADIFEAGHAQAVCRLGLRHLLFDDKMRWSFGVAALLPHRADTDSQDNTAWMPWWGDHLRSNFPLPPGVTGTHRG